MVSIDPAIALAALGEAVTVTGQAPGATAVATRAVVNRDANYADESGSSLRTMTLHMAAQPAYQPGDFVTARGSQWRIQAVYPHDDAAWQVCILRSD